MKSKKLVVDTSVIVKWVNSQNENLLEQADSILKDAEAKKVELLAPELAKYEVGNALLYKQVELPAAFASLGTVHTIPILFVPHSLIQAKETMEIAVRGTMTYYDASFVSLARQENAVLVTANPKHQQKFTDVKVVPLADYK